MFAKFLTSLLVSTPAPLNDTDARLALAALLVRVAKADDQYDAREAERITTVLMERYELDASAALALRADAETLEAEAPDTVRFTRAIKDATPYEERAAVVESLWSVVLADDVRDDDEDALLRMVSNLLGVADQDSALARQRASKAKK
jgi:uncharacterized tellurite resistance protein B-like protein